MENASTKKESIKMVLNYVFFHKDFSRFVFNETKLHVHKTGVRIRHVLIYFRKDYHAISYLEVS